MKKSLFTFLIFLPIGLFSQQKNTTENGIDLQESKCLDKSDITNAEMCNCTIEARLAWDKELNKYYNLLKTRLPKEAFDILKGSQREWMVYRDKEYLFISNYYYEVKQGTMWYAPAENRRKEIVKNRALEIQHYYEMLDF